MFKVVLPKVVSTSIDASSRFSTLSQLINYFVSLQCDYYLKHILIIIQKKIRVISWKKKVTLMKGLQNGCMFHFAKGTAG